jgi:phospholipase C
MARVLLWLLAATAVHVAEGEAPQPHEFSPAYFNALKGRLHTLSPDAANDAVLNVRPHAPPLRSQEKIDHFVVLFMENRAFDHLLGCMLGDKEGVDGIPTGGRSIPVDPKNASKGVINVTCGTAEYVCQETGMYDLFAGKTAKGGNPFSYPYSEQSDRFSAFPFGATGKEPAENQGGVAKGWNVQMFSGEQLPVKKTLADNFGVFNKWYTSVPSASGPNHMFAQSATSCGLHDNIQYADCGGPPNAAFPQMTIYDSLSLHNVSFGLFINSTCGMLVNGTPTPACNGTGVASVNFPDVGMAGVARHKASFHSQEEFYAKAASGDLPAFSWIMPPWEACDHPCFDVAKGEMFQKDIYEALRAGPKWSKTLFLIVYDDAGGLYDHIVPPHEGVPADNAACNAGIKNASDGTTLCRVNSTDLKCPESYDDVGPHGGCLPFDFRRLGLRSTAVLMSPWVGKGAVFQQPKAGKQSQFEHSSISATLAKLFNLSDHLTDRDAWAGSIDELLLDQPRDDLDMPMHLPDPPKFQTPWTPNPNYPPLGGRRLEVDSGGAAKATLAFGGASPPLHCSSSPAATVSRGNCEGGDARTITTKQRNHIDTLATTTNVDKPDVESMTFDQAHGWIIAHWESFMSQPTLKTDDTETPSDLDEVQF